MNAKTFSLPQVLALLKDPTFYTFTFLWITHGIGGWGISYVLPTVIYELGIDGAGTAISQLMTMPPSSMSFVMLIILGFLIHRGKLNPWVVGIGCKLDDTIVAPSQAKAGICLALLESMLMST